MKRKKVRLIDAGLYDHFLFLTQEQINLLEYLREETINFDDIKTEFEIVEDDIKWVEI